MSNMLVTQCDLLLLLIMLLLSPLPLPLLSLLLPMPVLALALALFREEQRRIDLLPLKFPSYIGAPISIVFLLCRNVVLYILYHYLTYHLLVELKR